MSLLRKTLLFLPLLLSGCGFSPMHGTDNALLDAGFVIEAPSSNLGRELKENLEDQLNPSGHAPAKPAYKLAVGITSSTSGVGVARDGTATRYNTSLSSIYQLIRLRDNRIISSGNLRHIASYNNQTNNYFSTTISERDSTQRAIRELSEMYRQRIGALVAEQKAAAL